MPGILSLKGSAEENNTELSLRYLWVFFSLWREGLAPDIPFLFPPPLSSGMTLVNATGKSFTVKSSLQFKVDQRDDGVAYTCSVEHVALSNPYMTTEVLEVHCECSNTSGKAGLRSRD